MMTSSRPRTGKTHTPPPTDYHTLHGVHPWYTSVFERFGWVMLAHHHGDTAKVAAYMDDLQCLRSTLRHKTDITESSDKLADLEIMSNNVDVLQRQALRVFKR